VDANENADRLLLLAGHLPGLVDVIQVLDIFQFWAPLLYALAFLVEEVGLGLDVVDDVLAGGSEASEELPAAVIGVDVVIYELLFEVVGTVAPILLQVYREISGNEGPPRVGDEPRSIQFAHERVYEGAPSLPILPFINHM